MLDAACAHSPEFYRSIRLHLVERSGVARSAQAATLARHRAGLVSSEAALPERFEGVLIANELLDALPVHQVVMRDALREVYVVARDAAPGRLVLVEGPPSTPALAEYLARLDVELQAGWRVEINLQAVDWIRDVARRLQRGFVIVIDYGHEARDLYSASHSGGTLTAFRQHRSAGPESGAPEWLRSAGEQDMTSHVDFTSLRAAAESEGLQTLGFLDQTYFLLGLLPPDTGDGEAMSRPQTVRMLKTLIVPGGLGSTHKVMIFGKGVGTPILRGCSYRMRVT